MQSSDSLRNQKVKAERIQGPMDLPFMLLVILLFSVGLVMMFSASYASAYYYESNSAYFLIKQGAIGAGGLAVMLFVTRINYQWFRVMAIPAMVTALVLLVVVKFVGPVLNGSQRWIYIGPISIQPSEIAKIAVIMMFASLISVYKEKMKTFRYGILPFAIILVIISALLAWEPHYSGLILIVAVGAIMLFVGGVNLGWFIASGIVVIGAIAYILLTGDHSSGRLSTWQDPTTNPLAGGYQILQSLYAVGSGGFLGLGLGKSRQKYLYLPEQHNDFVFAIVCEELGYVGALLVMALFALLIIRGFWIAARARDRFGSLLVTGVTSLFAIQVFLNIAVVTNLLPTTGISLPFFSYGGSSLVIQLVEMGIVLSVSRQIPAPKSG